MNYSFKDMTLAELQDMRNSLTQAIDDKKFLLESKEKDPKYIAIAKELNDFVKKHKKVKIEANIPVVIEYDLDLSRMKEDDIPGFKPLEYYHIGDLEQMFDYWGVYGYVKVGKGLKPGMKTFIDDHLECMELCPQGIKLFNPDLWKQMTADFKNFLKLKG